MKQDPKLVSKQKYEIAHIVSAFGTSTAVVKAIVKVVGISRRKVYTELKKLGYVRSNSFRRQKK